MESKQTAVDWYFDKIKSHFEHDGDLYEVACMTYAIAKLKEKEMIADCQSAAISQADMTNNRGYFDCEKYYNETYGKGENKV